VKDIFLVLCFYVRLGFFLCSVLISEKVLMELLRATRKRKTSTVDLNSAAKDGAEERDGEADVWLL
jgi:hypothetical protein